VGKAPGRARVRRHLPQPARHQDAHGGRARRARLARRLPLRLGELAAAPLQRPRQPAPARGDAARQRSPPTRATSWPPRRATSRRPTRPTPSTSASSSAIGRFNTSRSRAWRRRRPR
jgi:hypothetical protein